MRLPISPRAFRRYRTWQLTCAFGFAAGLVAGLAGSLLSHPLVELIGYAAAVVAFAVGVRKHYDTWVGINIDRRGREVSVTRCHPAFAAAAGTDGGGPAARASRGPAMTATDALDLRSRHRESRLRSSGPSALTKVYPGTDFKAVDQLDLTVGRRGDLRAARPQRRRQDDDRRHAHHPGHPHLGATPSSAASTWSPTRRWSSS